MVGLPPTPPPQTMEVEQWVASTTLKVGNREITDLSGVAGELGCVARAHMRFSLVHQAQIPSPARGEGQGEGALGRAVTAATPYPNLPPQGGKEPDASRVPYQAVTLSTCLKHSSAKNEASAAGSGGGAPAGTVTARRIT